MTSTEAVPDGAARREHRRERYQHYSQYPLFVLSLLFVVGFILIIDPNSTPEYIRVGRIMIWIGWGAFLIDYLVGLWLADSRGKYVRSHVLQAVGILIPPLRILLLGHIVRNMTGGAKRRFGGRVRIYALYLTTMTVVIAAVAVTIFERSAPNANIKSLGNALWWTTETVSTVGYGDYYPVTLGGRVVAVVLFINGIALLSAVTATISAKVLDYDDTTDTDSGVTLGDLHRQLASLEAQLGQLTAGGHPVAVPAAEGTGSSDDDGGG